MSYPLDFAYAWGRPEARAVFKAAEEDFYVEEIPGFDIGGGGEHLCLLIEKRGLSTPEAVKLLSRHCGVPPRDISYAGLKDRQGVTRQWIGLRVGLKREPPAFPADHPRLRILDQKRNSRKIRRGSHRGNFFRIRLRDVKGDAAALQARLERIRRDGVPNYFGPQRFGRDGGNVEQALRLFAGELRTRDRFLRGILISAARAWLFNALLSERVGQGNWDRYLQGDCFSLDGSSRGRFTPEGLDETLQARLEILDIHPSGPLWGRGEPEAQGEAAALERGLAERWPELCRGLEACGLAQERRALRLKVNDLQAYRPAAGAGPAREPDASGSRAGLAPADDTGSGDGADLMIEFSLSSGAYATSVLRELVMCQDA